MAWGQGGSQAAEPSMAWIWGAQIPPSKPWPCLSLGTWVTFCFCPGEELGTGELASHWKT